MTSAYSDPIQELMSLQRALGSKQSGGLLENGTSKRGLFPALNIFQDDEHFVAVAELPGVAKDEISIQVHRNSLRISGIKKPGYDSEASVHRRERKSGAFDRTITFPFNIDVDSVTAQFQLGVLSLRFTQPLSEKPKNIVVA